jgi:hypothetical protein
MKEGSTCRRQPVRAAAAQETLLAAGHVTGVLCGDMWGDGQEQWCLSLCCPRGCGAGGIGACWFSTLFFRCRRDKRYEHALCDEVKDTIDVIS